MSRLNLGGGAYKTGVNGTMPDSHSAQYRFIKKTLMNIHFSFLMNSNTSLCKIFKNVNIKMKIIKS